MSYSWLFVRPDASARALLHSQPQWCTMAKRLIVNNLRTRLRYKYSEIAGKLLTT